MDLQYAHQDGKRSSLVHLMSHTYLLSREFQMSQLPLCQANNTYIDLLLQLLHMHYMYLV
jgi:hypothetical protein